MDACRESTSLAGSPAVVTDAPIPVSATEVGGTWNAEGVILYGFGGRIRKVPATGGVSVALDLEDGEPAGATLVWRDRWATAPARAPGPRCGRTCRLK